MNKKFTNKKYKVYLLLFLATIFIIIVLNQFKKIKEEKKRYRSYDKNLNECTNNLNSNQIPYKGKLKIVPDYSYSNLKTEGPTKLDGLNYKELSKIRKIKIKKYSQLNFFHSKYDPFKYYHKKIYSPIIPNKKWLGTVPYFITNPYLPIIFTCAGHVSPINLFMRTGNIYYNNGVITQTYDSYKSKYWFDFVYSYKNNKGKIWAIMVNAWDAGFFFTYVDPSKSRNIIKEKTNHHITNSLHSCNYVFHVGKYNKNNLSPGRPDAWITLIKRNAYTKIYIKLWRKKPENLNSPADLIFILEVKI